MKLTAVINTYNEEKTIVRCLRSISPHVDEIVVVDTGSSDKTVELAKTFTKKVFKHESVTHVEPARNFAITKASGDWILVMDADEVLSEDLGLKLRKLAESDYSYYRIPRKNLIFGNWIKHTGWWPDYQIRFFQKGSVVWGNEIHSIPLTQGLGKDIDPTETLAITHFHHVSIEQYVERLNRYTSEEALEMVAKGSTFKWQSLLIKPSSEFLSRFFAWEGYKDGIHGLALSLLQSFSVLVVQLKLWETTKFDEVAPSNLLEEFLKLEVQSKKDMFFWYHEAKKNQTHGLTKTLHKIRAKIRI